MNYTIYDPVSGDIISTITISDPGLLPVMVGSAAYVAGHYPGDQYWIDAGQPRERPQAPSDCHVWRDRTWQLDVDLVTRRERARRDSLIAAIDRINPVWWSSLTTDQQQELKAYRQALLDVPQQATFPLSVEWPQQPTWFRQNA